MQVHVDDVEAHVAGAHLAEDGVEVGAVVVEQAAGVVDGFGDGFDLPLEERRRWTGWSSSGRRFAGRRLP